MNLITNTDLLNNLYKTQKKIDTMTSQLSTGLRVNKASDDPSSIVYTTRLTSQINEKELQLNHINKGQFILESMQVGFASLKRVTTEIENLIQTANNPDLTEMEKETIRETYDYLIVTYRDISENFEVESVNYLYGDEASYTVNTGYDKIMIGSAGVGLSQLEGISYPADIFDIPSIISVVYNTEVLSAMQTKYARIQESLTRYEELNVKQLELMEKDYSRITDADTAKATSELARLQILEQNNLMLMQVNDSTNQMLSNLLSF